MREIKILIAENNLLLREQLAEELLSDDQFELVGITANGPDTYNAIMREKPDVVVFDLLLPYYDGLTLIEKIRQDIENENIKLVMTTPLTKDSIISAAFRKGANYVIVKPYDIKMMAEKIKKIYYNAGTVTYTNSPAQNIDDIISHNLTNIGVPANLIGYRYMITAIKHVIDDESSLEGITKILYPDVAKIHNSTPQRVEKAIRHAIEVAWARNDSNKQITEFKYSIKPGKLRPTNSEFLAVMSRQIKL